MRILLTTLLSIFVALTATAQQTITVEVDNAAKILSELKSGEYNLVVKGNLKDIVKYDNYDIPQNNWIMDNNVTINTLDLSKCYGADSIMNVWICSVMPMEVEMLDGSGIVETKLITKYKYPKKIVLPDDIQYVDRVAVEFQVSKKNANFSCKNGCLLSKNGKILIYPKGDSQKIIPNGVEILSNDIFNVDDTIEVPNSVSFLGHSNYNPNWKIASDNNFFCIENGVLYNKDKSEILWAQNVSNDFQIPNTVKKIGYDSFLGNEKLTEFSIPEGVQIIDTSAFQKCRNLKSIKLPNSLKRIEYQAFCHCNQLTKINFPDNIQFIGEMAFFCDKYDYFNEIERDIHTDFPKSLKWIGAKFDVETMNFNQKIPLDKWYFTLNKNDWLDRKNGIPVSEIKFYNFEEMNSNDGKFFNDYLCEFPVCKLDDVKYDESYNIVSVGSVEYFVEKEIFDKKIKPYLSKSDFFTSFYNFEVEIFDGYDVSLHRVKAITPYFYKLD